MRPEQMGGWGEVDDVRNKTLHFRKKKGQMDDSIREIKIQIALFPSWAISRKEIKKFQHSRKEITKFQHSRKEITKFRSPYQAASTIFWKL